MENDQSSEIVSNNETEHKITENETPEHILQTQPVSAIHSESNNSFEPKKWIIVCAAGVLALAVLLIFVKGTHVCLAINCNEYSDSVATSSASSTSIGTDIVAYAGSAASLVILTTLVGVPLLPAVAVSTGIWFLIQMLH